jgi:hypothetical protein
MTLSYLEAMEWLGSSACPKSNTQTNMEILDVLITDFGRTHNLVPTQKLEEEASNANALATREEREEIVRPFLCFDCFRTELQTKSDSHTQCRTVISWPLPQSRGGLDPRIRELERSESNERAD